MNSSAITFNRASQRPYGCFSNLYRCDVLFDGLTFPTAEHAYQYGKPRKEAVRKWLMNAPSPSLLAMAAHGLYSWDISPGWSRGRRDRMRLVVRAKFEQHPDLAKVLLGTGNAEIVETPSVDSEVNRRWGRVNGRGANWLGEILMDVRSQIAPPCSYERHHFAYSHTHYTSPLVVDARGEGMKVTPDTGTTALRSREPSPRSKSSGNGSQSGKPVLPPDLICTTVLQPARDVLIPN